MLMQGPRKALWTRIFGGTAADGCATWSVARATARKALAHCAKRYIRRREKEDKDEESEVVLPPVNADIHDSVDLVGILLDGQPQGYRKHQHEPER